MRATPPLPKKEHGNRRSHGVEEEVETKNIEAPRREENGTRPGVPHFLSPRQTLLLCTCRYSALHLVPEPPASGQTPETLRGRFLASGRGRASVAPKSRAVAAGIAQIRTEEGGGAQRRSCGAEDADTPWRFSSGCVASRRRESRRSVFEASTLLFELGLEPLHVRGALAGTPKYPRYAWLDRQTVAPFLEGFLGVMSKRTRTLRLCVGPTIRNAASSHLITVNRGQPRQSLGMPPPEPHSSAPGPNNTVAVRAEIAVVVKQRETGGLSPGRYLLFTTAQLHLTSDSSTVEKERKARCNSGQLVPIRGGGGVLHDRGAASRLRRGFPGRPGRSFSDLSSLASNLPRLVPDLHGR